MTVSVSSNASKRHLGKAFKLSSKFLMIIV